jgi:hypothetical protein
MKNYRQYQEDLPRSTRKDDVGSIMSGRQYHQNGSESQEHGRYRNDNQEYYVDTYEQDKKRMNQNYSNLLGQKLGDRENMGEYQDPAEYGKNTLEMTVSQREQVPDEEPPQKLLPSIHYSEFKNSGYYQQQPQPKSNLKQMEERTQRMKEALQKNPPTPSQQTISEQTPSNQGRDFYRQAMGHGTNPINYTENREIYGKALNEHEGDVVIRFYKVQGYKYTLMNQSDKEIQAQFLRNGYHIMNLQIVRDPISGDANGTVTFKARLVADQERLFEHFMKTNLNYVVMAKK